MWKAAAPAAIALALLPAAPAAACDDADRLPAELRGHARNVTVLCLINQQRASQGLDALRLSRKLGRVARAHSADMVERHYFSHDSPGGRSFAARIASSGWTRGRRRWVIGETLAWGTGARATPRSTVDSWMQSPAHRRELLASAYRVAGVGVALGVPPRDAGDGATYTVDFGG